MMNNVSESFCIPWIYYVSNTKFLDVADYNNTTHMGFGKRKILRGRQKHITGWTA